MMTESSGLAAIRERLERVERDNRRLRALALLVVAGAIPLLFTQCSGGRMVKTEMIVIEDADGKTRASLGLEDEGARLRLYDSNGIRRASLSVAANGDPGLALFDAADRPGVIVELTKAGPALVLTDASGKTLFERP
ncbi:MAG: hypothetical protein ACREQY_23495 [Candidatus Binatia bacterium]